MGDTNERGRGWWKPRDDDHETESTAARIDEVLGLLATGVRRVLERPPSKAPTTGEVTSK